ncbi:hypothetical protein [Marinifilum caeruleilacunae]|uniref:Uncharacterized protein n=1 Tax=Marinifilum caeruleilacunae TaxID=2499076 RepID=A0ABX1WTS5_9BACT|nr:hypothetical protein [Marinifilum caeruleilacunae]NOU59499.1 hypothetical protein [Marinifilum caeruleilacunae]
MKTFKTILMMMLLATVTLSSCDNEDTDLTGDVIIQTYGESYSGGSFDIYTEVSALADGSSSTVSYPIPVREGYLSAEAFVDDLNHGTYYLVIYRKDSYNGRSVAFQVTGGQTTTIIVSSSSIDIEY